MDYKDYYATLGVSKKASQDEVQKAYRKLARKYHPDVNREPEAEDRFKEITEAYEVLKDSEKRKVYDRFGKNWKQAQAQGFGGSGGQGFSGGVPPGFEGFRVDFGGGGGGGGGGASGYSSFFDMLFGGGNPFGDDMGGFGRGGGRRGRAGGGGAEWNLRGQDHEARLVLTLEEAARGGQREIGLADPVTGESKTYSVTIPAGVREGQKIRLAGRGGAGAGGGGAGDLYLKVELKPHDRFRRDGNDLYVSLPVTPWDAALGAKAAVPTLNGTLTLKVPPGSSTGRKIRLRGKGLPNPKGADGDLYAEIEVVVPDKLSAEERELFEKLSEVSSFRAGAA